MTRNNHHPYRLARYVALGAGEGIVAGWVLLMLLIKLNIMGLGDLIHRSADGLTALLMMLAFFGITFGMVGIAWRVMFLLPDEED